MMKMNAGAWIGIIAGIVGFLVAIGAVIATMDSEASFMVIGMFIVFGGVFFLIFKLIIKPMLNARRLMRIGVPATARILEVKDTRVTVNDQPQVKLLLEVKNDFGKRYQTGVRTLVPRLNPQIYQPGMEVEIRVDPKNEMNVVVVPGGMQSFRPGTGNESVARGRPVNESAVREELEMLQKSNESIAQTGRSARAVVKKYNWLGVNVNGENPYVELELEVLPEHSASFAATAKGVIAQASIAKFQPGSVIQVKYDYYDNSRVTIDRSGG